MEWITNPESLIALLTLTVLEIVLGIDNIIFISILSGKLPKEQQNKARLTGLALAMISRILLLFSIVWIMKLTLPLFTVLGQEISGRDLILIGGGLFLIAKSTFEIHDKLEGEDTHSSGRAAKSFSNVIVQILSARYCIFIGFGYNCSRNGKGINNYGACSNDCSWCDDGIIKKHKRFC